MRFYNTLTREIEEFKPLDEKEVTLYSCGPTVYDYAHIGNLRTYIFVDILKRALIFNGYNVKHVMNITDVGHLTGDRDAGEDKIEKKAALEEKNAWELAEFYTNAFKKDLKELNILEPTIWAKATDHIPKQIELVKKLEEKGFLYRTSDGMYFDTSKFADYGKLARLNVAGQEEGARVEVNVEKRNPADFAVWKFSPTDKKRQMEWDSPWGKGSPGWHIECSAMSMEYLGETLDIHTGAIDLIPVHHTNEIAQSEAMTGKKFVNYWLHGEFLLINDGRMGKSEGNFIILQNLLDNGLPAIVYRLFCLSSHYRSKLNFSWEAMAGALNNWQKLRRKFLDLGKQPGQVEAALLARFMEYVNDDLSLPQALAVMWDVFKSNISDFDKRSTLLKFDEVFGLGLAELKEDDLAVPEDIQKIFLLRNAARDDKDWDKADALREQLAELGWEVEDMVDSTRLKKK